MSHCPDCRAVDFRAAPLLRRCQPCTEKRRGDQRDFFLRTGHCGACGNPGSFCQCETQCGCHELHECGSGRGKDAAEVFAETPVIDGQETLL